MAEFRTGFVLFYRELCLTSSWKHHLGFIAAVTRLCQLATRLRAETL
jgi:hypothetical protein